MTIRGGTLFTGNFASVRGGAIVIERTSKSNITSVTCTANKAVLGGAIALRYPSDNDRVYDKCVFADNTAINGGAVYLYGDSGHDVITDSVFRGNYASKCRHTAVWINEIAPIRDTEVAR
ncbi:unnamed protein product [Laminaria digitata]